MICRKAVRFFLFLALIFLSHPLESAWQENLRPCEENKSCTSIAGVDFIYMINLKTRTDKLALSLRRLKNYGIIPYRFDAIDGWSLPSSLVSNLQPTPLSRVMNQGRIGCLLSHISVLQDAYISGYNTIWVMEDDVDVKNNPSALSDLISSLDQNGIDWDILYTDVETKDSYGIRRPPTSVIARPGAPRCDLSFYKRRYPINEVCTEVGMRFGCYSMIIRRSGIEKILHYFAENNLFLPIDNELPHVSNLKQITLTRDIVSHRVQQDSNTQMSQRQHQILNQKLERKK